MTNQNQNQSPESNRFQESDSPEIKELKELFRVLWGNCSIPSHNEMVTACREIVIRNHYFDHYKELNEET